VISAGRMNERVSLLAPSESRSPMGEATLTFTAEATVWAEVEGLAARDILQAQQADVVATHRIRIRHRPSVTYQYRVQWRGKTMEVASITDRIDRTMTELLVREVI
jgi:SPP1 family predicted phage head-tail adaptor